MVHRELPWSWHNSSGWEGQLERTKRWHSRLKSADTLEDAEDFVFTFFQNCYALREWLTRSAFDPTFVKELFTKTPELRLCRDLANLTKHGDLSRPPSTGRQPSIAREYVDPGHGWCGGDSRLVVLSQGRKIDAMNLADRCLEIVLALAVP
jgi:hypothetical protein